MFAIEEAKLPPPNPAVMPAAMNIQYGVPGVIRQ
jgi:hypothetical protein